MFKAFTLIELLIVIAIIAIISIVVVLVLNPAQLLQQSRDGNRLSDMASLNSALGIYLAQGGTSLGNANTMYVSIPDPAATSTAGDQCQGLGLLPAPSGYTYQCAASSTYRATNGTGWIPVNLLSLPAGSPFSQLPIDPVNQTTTNLFYSYITNGSGQFAVAAAPESQKYSLGGSNDATTNNDGIDLGLIEKGNDVALYPPRLLVTSGLELWLKADSITGLSNGQSIPTWSDSSGNGYNASQSTSSYQPTYQTNVVNGHPAVSFNGSTQYFNNSSSLPTASAMTFFGVASGTGWMFSTTCGNQTFRLELNTNYYSYAYRTIAYGSTQTNSPTGQSGFNVGTFSYSYPSPSTLIAGINGNDSSSAVSTNLTQFGNGGYPVTGGWWGACPTPGTLDYFNGQIAEIILFNNQLSTTQDEMVEAYLEDKYGL